MLVIGRSFLRVVGRHKPLHGAFDFYLDDMRWSDENLGLMSLEFNPVDLTWPPVNYGFDSLIADRFESISAHGDYQPGRMSVHRDVLTRRTSHFKDTYVVVFEDNLVTVPGQSLSNLGLLASQNLLRCA